MVTSSPAPANRRYFPGLNGLRLIAALVVIVEHIEQTKEWFGFAHHYWLPIRGKIGVVLFFVLSGFLITYLLLEERGRSDTISFKNFYVRRILRIWPLYYLIVLASLLVLPHIGLLAMPGLPETLKGRPTGVDLVLFFAILPNFVGAVVPFATQTWSIGIEEQFYFIQPLAVRFVRAPKRLALLLLVVCFSTEILSLAQRITLIVHVAYDLDFRWMATPVTFHVIELARFSSCIAIGCLSAMAIFYEVMPVRRLLFRRDAQVVSYLLLGVLLYLSEVLKIGQDEFRLHAVLFAAIVLNVACNPHTLFRLENRVLSYLGSISYGLYMYHLVCAGVVVGFLWRLKLPRELPLSLDLAAYCAAIGLTVVVSALSYRFFEGFFLGLKKRFAGKGEGARPASSSCNAGPEEGNPEGPYRSNR